MGARERVVLGRYAIEGSAGLGALGTVHAARDGADAVAISEATIDIEPPQQRAAVLRKVRQRVSARAFVHHPSLVAVRDCVEYGDALYVITERLGGTPLDRLHGARTPHILDWFEALCDVMSVLHEGGVFSGGLAPDAVLVDERGHLRLVDFGLADAFATHSGGAAHALDAVHYTAPEVLRGASPDACSDLFSLGATLQGLLFDRPFTPRANQYLPRAAREFIAWLTAPDPGARPASLAEVRSRWPEARACLASWSRPSITMTTQAAVQSASCLCLEAAGEGTVEVGEAVRTVLRKLVGRPPALEEIDAQSAVIVFTAPPRGLLALLEALLRGGGLPPLRVGLHCGAWSACDDVMARRLVSHGRVAARASRGAFAATWPCARALQGSGVRISGARLVEGEPGEPVLLYRAHPLEVSAPPDLVLRAPFASSSGICLRVTAGDVAGLVVGLPRGGMELGRGESTNVGATRLTFAEPTISRTQAWLEWDDVREGFTLRHEPAATNATHVNNRPVDLEELTIGDTVRMGHLVFTLERDLASAGGGPGEPGA